VHVTLRVRPEVRSLRSQTCFNVVRRAFREGHARFGFRLNHFSVMGNHVHLVVEACDRRALARGVQGLTIRIAKGVNRLTGRRGRVFADRYHARVLRTPSEVRNALGYVVHNHAKHAREQGLGVPRGYVDRCSSLCEVTVQWDDETRIIVAPETWLLRRAVAALRPG
jgi:putative transposase